MLSLWLVPTFLTIASALCLWTSQRSQSRTARRIVRGVAIYVLISTALALYLQFDCLWSDFRHHNCRTLPAVILPFAQAWNVLSWVGIPFVSPALLLFACVKEVLFRRQSPLAN